MPADPVLIGSASSMTFLLAAETGCQISSFKRSVKSKKLAFYDASVGYTTGKIFHDFSAEYNFSGRKTGSTGLAAAAPAVAITFANFTTGNGVSAGGIYTDTVDVDHGEENVRMISGTAEQMPGIS